MDTTTLWLPKRWAISETSPGFSSAAVCRITFSTPEEKILRACSMLEIPPPYPRGMKHSAATLSINA
ncbi:hypothetical protein D3C78_1710650 [compost metagenome]